MSDKCTIDMTSFRIHIIAGYIGNIMLVEYPNQILLFDSGCVNDVKRIEHYCRQVLQRQVSDIDLMAVTHMHPDHSGGAASLRARHGIPVAAHREADRWYKGLGGMIQQKLDCYMATSVAFRNHRSLERILYDRSLKPDHLLQDGDAIPFFPDWQVMHVPGHILHDLAFYHPQERVLYIADLICDVKGKPQLPLPIMFPQMMAASYDRLAALDARIILRAHGDPIFTDNSAKLFGHMKNLLTRPPTSFMKRVWLMSIYSPEYRHRKES